MFGGKAKRQLARLQQEHAALIADVVEKDEKIAALEKANVGLEAANVTLRRWRREDVERLDARVRTLASQLNEQVDAAVRAEHELTVVGKSLNEALTERDDARETLRKIADMPTAGAAPIGKRMAKVAAEHLASVAGAQAEAA